ncbi:MAG: sugar transferase [Fimbriimonas sp.]
MAVEELNRLDYEVLERDSLSEAFRAFSAMPTARPPKSDRSIRTFDVAFTTVGLIFLTPLLIGTGIAIALESRGGVLFRQPRVGKDGRTFHVWKFRTMRPAKPGDPSFSVSNDERITRVGRLLRKTKIDELPQLFNVLKGEMSLVGPRPQVPDYFEFFPITSHATITSVPPGVTGLSQLALPAEDELLAKVECPEKFHREYLPQLKASMDGLYVQNRSLRLNVAVLWQTALFVVLRRKPKKIPVLGSAEFSMTEEGFRVISLR